ncbi:hypothetical protein TRFO_03340 [Tritrichomonas foetus]|uniref:Right handed beta helix domain-containing protein n=1 Tax=Tritrichomonas foetus TaxID=1144522 RepID=A0A1J4KR50_9EUKA|nr:hypothetical protein TRFO_03340 [Tritrichomonas foetus]|eukprot:OHT13578.1 hypothetical protein TRFO_03340 [Tritrichomonas foetus]
MTCQSTMISSQFFSLTSLALIANLSLTGSFSRMYVSHPGLLGLSSSFSRNINLYNFKSHFSSAPLIYGTFNTVLLSNVHVSNSLQPVNINKETIGEPADYYQSKVTITNSVFEGCFIEGDEHHGGAIEFESCLVKINKCVFDYCFASHGGAIYANDTTIEIKNTNFTSNSAIYYGGALLMVNSKFTITGGFSRLNSALFHACFDIHECNGTIDAHHLLNNTADDDCAGISIRESTVDLHNMYFIHNHANMIPGAIQIEEGDRDDAATKVRITRCFFISNEAQEEPINIQFYGQFVEGTVERCVFDAPLKEAIFESFDPKVKITNCRYSVKISNPFKNLIEDHLNIIEYSKSLEHTKSDYLATILILAIPTYIGIVFFILLKTK